MAFRFLVLWKSISGLFQFINPIFVKTSSLFIAPFKFPRLSCFMHMKQKTLPETSSYCIQWYWSNQWYWHERNFSRKLSWEIRSFRWAWTFATKDQLFLSLMKDCILIMRAEHLGVLGSVYKHLRPRHPWCHDSTSVCITRPSDPFSQKFREELAVFHLLHPLLVYTRRHCNISELTKRDARWEDVSRRPGH